MNKEPLTIEEIKKISLDILKDVHEFCESNNIKYYLACGTLLGAIRHQGFIPWDDDIDIMMPRPDYNRFLNEYKSENYKLLKPSSGEFYYAKVYDTKTIKLENGKINKNVKGIDIDIFPLDGIVNDQIIIDKIMKRSKFLETLLRLANQPIFYRKNPLKAINRIVPRIIGKKNIVKLIEKNAQSYKYEDSEYVARIRNTPNGFTGALKKEVYDEPIKVKFEDGEFYVPRDYDVWLKAFFGDYMTPPPIEKRKSHHQNRCYYKD